MTCMRHACDMDMHVTCMRHVCDMCVSPQPSVREMSNLLEQKGRLEREVEKLRRRDAELSDKTVALEILVSGWEGGRRGREKRDGQTCLDANVCFR